MSEACEQFVTWSYYFTTFQIRTSPHVQTVFSHAHARALPRRYRCSCSCDSSYYQVVVRSLSEAVQVLRAIAILDSDTMRVVNMKNRFSPDYDAAPSGGYVHALQLLTCCSHPSVYHMLHCNPESRSMSTTIMFCSLPNSQCVRALCYDCWSILTMFVDFLHCPQRAMRILFCCADANFADIRSIASQVS